MDIIKPINESSVFSPISSIFMPNLVMPSIDNLGLPRILVNFNIYLIDYSSSRLPLMMLISPFADNLANTLPKPSHETQLCHPS